MYVSMSPLVLVKISRSTSFYDSLSLVHDREKICENSIPQLGQIR